MSGYYGGVSVSWTLIAIFVPAIAFFLFAKPPPGVLVAAVLVMAVFTRPLIYSGSDWPERVADIATGAPGITMLSATLVVFALANPLPRGFPSVWGYAFLSLIGLAFGYVAFWSHSLAVNVGTLHLALSLLAFPAGYAIGARKHTVSDARFIATTVLALACCAVAIEAYQMVSGVVDELGRPSAAFQHSAVVGKLSLIMLIAMLPLLRHEDKRVSRRAFLAVTMCAVATGLTLSRANSICIVAVFVAWELILSPRGRVRRQGSRAPMIFIVSALAALFAPTIIDRFRTDPDGGGRPEMMEAALTYLPDYWLTGTGPNNYTIEFMRFSTIVMKTTRPVHNSAMLLLLELGVFIAFLYALPLLVAWLRGARNWIGNFDQRLWGRSLAIGLVGVGASAMTGWAFIQEPALGFLLFVTGYATGRLAAAGLEPMAEPLSDVGQVSDKEPSTAVR